MLRRLDRHPVLVLPGLGGGDGSTRLLRRHIAALGFRAHGWRLGRNVGPTDEIIDGLGGRFTELADRYGQPVSLVGWSLGGVYAWALARRHPSRVRQVITLGSPLRSTGVGNAVLAVPATSIWSRNDRIVSWQSSMIEEGERAENVEVHSTHLTLGFDPLVVLVVTDRLSTPADRWRPFRPPWWLRGVYPRPSANAA
jgi:pimeloyl-ACP methyl ester carboxylesterase